MSTTRFAISFSQTIFEVIDFSWHSSLFRTCCNFLLSFLSTTNIEEIRFLTELPPIVRIYTESQIFSLVAWQLFLVKKGCIKACKYQIRSEIAN